VHLRGRKLTTEEEDFFEKLFTSTKLHGVTSYYIKYPYFLHELILFFYVQTWDKYHTYNSATIKPRGVQRRLVMWRCWRLATAVSPPLIGRTVYLYAKSRATLTQYHVQYALSLSVFGSWIALSLIGTSRAVKTGLATPERSQHTKKRADVSTVVPPTSPRLQKAQWYQPLISPLNIEIKYVLRLT
jgi:hypothetical protein